MALWTDLIEPAELTGFVRAAFEDIERSKGLLARFLPNTFVPDIDVRFSKGDAGLVEEASYRAYDAEPEVVSPGKHGRVVIELPAIGSVKPISEYLQLRSRGATDEALRNVVLKEALRSVQGVSDRTERMRGTVLVTGKATIDQENFAVEDDFGRDSSMKVTASTLWNASGAKVLDDLIGWAEAYADLNGERPGALVLSSKAARAIRAATEFQVKLIDGASRPASMEQVNSILDSEGLPPVVVYDRRTQRGGKRLRVLPEDTALLLPAPVDPDAEGASALGATFWGQTLGAVEEDMGIDDDQLPGIVASLDRAERTPRTVSIDVDAIALPVLANANLAMAAKVL
ncbi:major capsid protein [Actinomyces bowdenii]|uniref:Major capsid protein n=1 Tax=Actinomyces bowdenii TaxID=131109 RepID=A0A853EG41_9ACTO|nr:major capsid protein [Actinomyces bowdenii]MBF0696135.1 major capsid protein [Actinomyces bowdenii]NYS68308.1 major capsid protein [Actinomyces bowdenii]